MRFACWLSVPAVALVLTGPLLAADAEAKTPKDVAAFGTLRAPDAGVARSQAEAWLKGVGKADDKVMAEFAKVWDGDRPVLDKVADTLALGNADAAKALADARDLSGDAPTAIPAFLKAGKKADYLRDNLALAYAKALSNRKVFEEALEALKTVKAENVVDPASYYFHRAVAEHALLLKKDADDSITHLLDDVMDAPERYRMVAALMAFDMLTWRDKDLGWIARKMGNVERRLELHRGGKQTQKIQKEVVARLDEIIKELENKNKGGGSWSNGGGWPNGGQSGSSPNNNIQASSPQNDSNGGNGSGPGLVDQKRVKDLAAVWGKLPEKERAKAMQDLTRGMPPKYREAIETYFRKLGEGASR